MEGSGTALHIRYAGRDELRGIAAFLHESWQAEYRQIISKDYLEKDTVADRHKRLLKRHDDKTSDFMVMYDADMLVGVSVFGKCFTEGYENDGEISAIYLRHDYIGKGYGHTFFIRVEQELASKGYDYLVLDLLSGNDRAYRFYLDHGYEHAQDRYYKIDGKDYPLILLRKKSPDQEAGSACSDEGHISGQIDKGKGGTDDSE